MPGSTVAASVSTFRRVPLGLRYMAGAAFFFSIMSLLVKIAGRGVPPMQIVMVRCVVMGVLSWGMLRQAGVSARGTNHLLLIARGVFGFAALSLFYFAITRLPLGDVVTIHHINPVLTALLAGFLLRERVSPIVLFSAGLSLGGVALVAQPTFLFGGIEPLPPVAVAAVLVSAVLSAVAYNLVRKLRETEHPLVVVYWFSLVAVVASVPFVALEMVWPTPLEWLVLLGVGLATQAAQVCLTRGLHLEAAGRATAVGYLQIVFAFVWGLLFLGEVPDVLSLLGAGVIVVSVVLVTRRS